VIGSSNLSIASKRPIMRFPYVRLKEFKGMVIKKILDYLIFLQHKELCEVV
jgi:hypothetical protein